LWTIARENAGTPRNAEQLLTEIIRGIRIAPVILWSVANGTPLGDARLKFLSTLAGLAHELDSTRLITAALETHRIDENTVMVDDSLGQFSIFSSQDEPGRGSKATGRWNSFPT
jgi:beta-glucuronidase